MNECSSDVNSDLDEEMLPVSDVSDYEPSDSEDLEPVPGGILTRTAGIQEHFVFSGKKNDLQKSAGSFMAFVQTMDNAISRNVTTKDYLRALMVDTDKTD